MITRVQVILTDDKTGSLTILDKESPTGFGTHLNFSAHREADPVWAPGGVKIERHRQKGPLYYNLTFEDWTNDGKDF